MGPPKVTKKLAEMHFEHHGHLSFSKHQSPHVSFNIKSEMYSGICYKILFSQSERSVNCLVGRGTS